MKRFLLPLLVALAASPAWAGNPGGARGLPRLPQRPDQNYDLPSGEKLSLYVDQGAFAKSVHGETLRCTECHTDKTSDHATGELKFKSAAR